MTREQREALTRLLPEGQVRFDEPMALHSLAAVGGPAEAFVQVAGLAELKRVFAWAAEEAIDYRIWGAGSATLVRDGGLSGLVIALGGEFGSTAIERAADEELLLAVGAATPMAELRAFCEAQGLAGMEPLAGERGTVGGALCTSGAIAGEALAELTMVTKDGRELTLTRQALRFEEGRLRMPRTAAIVRALFSLSREAAAEPATLTDASAAAPEEPMPCFARVFTSPCKTAPEVLIEEAGLPGVRVGAARVPATAANAIQNEGKATARDIIVLLNLMRDRVRESSGVTLEPAIEVIGER